MIFTLIITSLLLTLLSIIFYKDHTKKSIEKKMKLAAKLEQKRKENLKRSFFENVEKGSVNKLKIMLEENEIDLNQYDDHGETALSIAIQNANINLLEFLLKNGSESNLEAGGNERLPLEIALELENPLFAFILLEHGADPTLCEQSLILNKIVLEDEKLWSKLLEKGVDVNISNDDGMSPLILEITMGHLKKVISLLEHEANPNMKVNAQIDGQYVAITPLIAAIQYERVEIVKVLIEKGADVKDFILTGHTPLKQAILSDSIELVDIIFSAGGNPNGPITSTTPLILAIIEKKEKIIPYLLEKGVSPEQIDINGRTPLTSAIKANLPNIILQLIRSGADVNRILENGSSPLQIAALEGNYELMNLLIENGATELGTIEGKPFLSIIAFEGNIINMEFFLERNFDVNVKSKNGETPLMMASLSANTSMIKLLLKHNADVDAFELMGGENAISLSAGIGKKEIALEILKHRFGSPEATECDILQILTEKAENGDLNVQFHLAWLYHYGIIVSADFTNAAYWYEKAAQQGHEGAMMRTGNAYSKGRGIGKNSKVAVDWFKKAAKGGMIGVFQNIGNAYYLGNGVIKDYSKAVEWYKKGAEIGDESSQFNLAKCIIEGKGIQKDPEMAINWYEKAAHQGKISAIHNLAVIYLKGDEVPLDEKKGVQWLKVGADKGNPECQFLLGLQYRNGVGEAKDNSKASFWLIKALLGGFDDAAKHLSIQELMNGAIFQNNENDTEKSIRIIKAAYQKAYTVDDYCICARKIADHIETNGEAVIARDFLEEALKLMRTRIDQLVLCDTFVYIYKNRPGCEHLVAFGRRLIS